MKNNYLTLLFLFSICLGFAQTKDSLSVEEQARREKNIQAGNPFKEFGYIPKIATLSKGKYLEFHDLDSIVQVGTFMYNTRSKSIVSIIENDTLPLSEATLQPEIISRWMNPDPLAEEFPSWTPYHYVHNNPIIFIDPTGMSADWYENSDGNVVYDENIKSQEDLDKDGIDGKYIAESFLGADQNGQVFNFQSDGNVSYTPGATTSAYIAGGIPENAFVAIESTPLGTKSGDSMVAAGAVVATPTSSNPFGAIINATAGLALLITAAVQISGDNDMQHRFSKVARGNQRDSGLQGVTDAEIAQELNNLRGNLNKEQKAQKIRLQKEQKVRGQRNIQKKNSEKGTGTGRQ